MSEEKIGWLSRELAVPGVALAVYDSGGPGQVILFLHGLGGYALECSAVASRLGNEYRVVSLDQRGHGSSTTRPDDLSRAAFVSDAVAVIENVDVGPVMVVGQSFGAHTALLLAASRPELVSALILVEGGVGGGGQEATNEVIDWFASWPTPFADTTAAATYFGGGGQVKPGRQDSRHPPRDWCPASSSRSSKRRSMQSTPKRGGPIGRPSARQPCSSRASEVSWSRPKRTRCWQPTRWPP
ncbi:alpha/beta hydrolase [Micromonospora sp. C51]|nr:alpha/beta hydrolase [Micromonospora sp. C51]